MGVQNEIDCTNIEEHYESYFLRELAEQLDESIIEHLSKCTECYKKYLIWVRSNKDYLSDKLSKIES